MEYSEKKSKKGKIIFKYILPALIILVMTGFLIGVEFFLPSRITLQNNQSSEYKLNLPVFLSANASLTGDTSAVTAQMAVSVHGEGGVAYIRPSSEGEAKITLKLFGLIPVKDVVVKVMPDTDVYVGGEPVGISIKSEGLVVVDFSRFKDENHMECDPADKSGLKKGDMILKCNGNAVTDSDEFAEIVKNSNGGILKLLCIRDGITFNADVKPVLSEENKIYKIGAWVRDGVDGIGTLTFVDKTTGIYGSVGHGINDSDLNMLYTVGSGKAYNAEILKIEQGKDGTPGELKGIFSDMDEPVGDVRINCSMGVYGKYYGDLKNKKQMPIGMSYEVHTGKATILTSLGDDLVREYQIEITKAYKNKVNDTKSMVIKVTDPELLKRTGGIIQGMSGSPIIQDGKLIGAVTHVLINDSTVGYGIFIESMLNNMEYTAKLAG